MAELASGKIFAEVPFPLFCITCGLFPLLVLLDGNRKSNFTVKGINFGASVSVVLAVCTNMRRWSSKKRESRRQRQLSATASLRFTA